MKAPNGRLWRQLWTLALCRFAEPFALACFLPYVPAYLQHLSVPPDRVATWIGVLGACFSVCEALFAIPMTNLAERLGSKRVLLLSAVVQMAANLSIGFCTRLWHVVVCIIVVGIANGNVAIMRAMVAKAATHKSDQARAFSFLPTSAGIGTILGPASGGFLATVKVSETFPFLVPSLVITMLYLPGLIVGLLMLEDDRLDTVNYHLLTAEDEVDELHGNETTEQSEMQSLDHTPTGARTEISGPVHVAFEKGSSLGQSSKLKHALNPFIWLNALTGLHSIGFDHMLTVFLQYPSTPKDSVRRPWSLLHFAIGLGRDSRFTGGVLTTAGIAGILAATLLYPTLSQRFSHLTALRAAIVVLPAIYLVFPFTALLEGPGQVLALLPLLLLKTAVAVAALQASMILLTNSVPEGEVPRVHGVNFTIAAACRAVGTVSSGALFSLGLRWGYVILPFWSMACWAIMTVFLAAVRTHSARTGP